MKNNKEIKIYEALGIKYFKKIVLLNLYLFASPIVLLKKPKLKFKEIKREVNKYGSNYFIGTNTKYEKVKKFKYALYLNTFIHLHCYISIIKDFIILFSSPSLNSLKLINIIILSILNTYCLILQRYNYIRINNFLNKMAPIYHKKRNNEISLIKKEDSLLKKHTYKSLDKKNKYKETNLDEMINYLSLEELQKLRDDLISIQNYNHQSNIKIRKKNYKIEYK